MSRPALLALVLALLAPAAAGDGPAAYAPLSVAAEALDPTAAFVEWSPGLEPAEAYRVYGVNGAALTLLVDTSDLPAPLVLAVVVPAGYETYAVSGVQGNAESAPVFAANGVSLGCIYVTIHPPDVWTEKCEARALSFRNPLS